MATEAAITIVHRRCTRCDFRHEPDSLCVTVDLTEINYKLDELISTANYANQGMHLAGIGPVEISSCPECKGLAEVPNLIPEDLGARMVPCPACNGQGDRAVCVDQLELLRLALKSAYHRVRELQTHTHEWDRDEEYPGPTRCNICGAHGDA